MDSAKILKIAQQLNTATNVLDMLNSGDFVKMTFESAKGEESIRMSINPDDKRIYALSESIGKAVFAYHRDTEQELIRAVR